MIHQILVYILLWYPWWRHQMKTFSALLALCAGNSLVISEFPAKKAGDAGGGGGGGVMFSLIWAWTNGCANIRDAGDLRRHRAHDVIIMLIRVQHIRRSLWTYNVFTARHGNRFKNVCRDYFYVPSCSNKYIVWDLFMNYYPLFRVRSRNNGVRCMSFYILICNKYTK